jgi:chaperone protein EcpD
MKSKSLLLFTSLLLLAGSVQASIQVMGTRIIFNATEKEQSVRINNVGQAPALIQVWLDSRKNSKIDEKENIPFLINPPISRINTAKGKVLRIFQTDETVNHYAKDRESLLWLNILDIPPEDEAASEKNLMNIAVRTRLKFFYRPAGLKGDPIVAAENIKWGVSKTAKGYSFTGTNDSPFYISFASMKLSESGKDGVNIQGDMIEPFSSKTFEFSHEGKSSAPTLVYTFITDLGAMVTKEFKS